MKLNTIFITLLIINVLITSCRKITIREDTNKDNVIVDYTMAEKAIEWLEFINTGADNKSIRKYFMKNVATTKGCKSIINHWRRFMKWNNDEFFIFILDKIPIDEPLKNEDGSLTGLGKRRGLWLSALDNPQKLKEDIENLKRANLIDTSLTLAKKYLPEISKVENNFYIVLFGGSSAYAVKNENGFDLLQLPKLQDGTIDVEEVIATFAHEMHHTGFNYCTKKYMKHVKEGKNIQLLAILAAEGMPTYIINRTRDNLKKYKLSKDQLLQEIVNDWQTHLDRLPQLYIEAENDISLNLTWKIGQEEIWKKMDEWHSRSSIYFRFRHVFSY